MEKGNTNPGTPQTPLRLSSKITLLSKVIAILVGIPISAIIMFNTHYVWWGVLIGLVGISVCVAFTYLAVDAHLHKNDILISGLFEAQKRISISAIQKIKKFKSRRQTYFYYETPRDKFLIICPISGDGRKVLYKLYNEFKENPQGVRTSFLK